MGTILSQINRGNEKVDFKVRVDYVDALLLSGRTTNVHLFSEDVALSKSNILARGKHGETKYFLVPKNMNQDLKSFNEIRCQRMETESSIVLFFVINKN